MLGVGCWRLLLLLDCTRPRAAHLFGGCLKGLLGGQWPCVCEGRASRGPSKRAKQESNAANSISTVTAT
jgi:hypothetical protein